MLRSSDIDKAHYLPLPSYSQVKQSHYWPGQAQIVPRVWGSQISRQSAHEGGKVVSPIHWPPLLPRNIPGTHFCYRAIVRLEILCQGKIPMTPATFRLVAQCLNQLRHRLPLLVTGCTQNSLLTLCTLPERTPDKRNNCIIIWIRLRFDDGTATLWRRHVWLQAIFYDLYNQSGFTSDPLIMKLFIFIVTR